MIKLYQIFAANTIKPLSSERGFKSVLIRSESAFIRPYCNRGSPEVIGDKMGSLKS